MGKTRAQSSMEYIAVVAIVTAIILPTAFIFLSYSQKSQEELKIQQVSRIGRDIVDNAESIYYSGPPSRTTVMAALPDNILNISIMNDTNRGVFELVFVMGTPSKHSEASFSSGVDIRGSFDKKSVNPGLRKVILQATKGDRYYVQINIT